MLLVVVGPVITATAFSELLMMRVYKPLVLPLERGGSSAVGRGRAGYNRPDHTILIGYSNTSPSPPPAAQ